MHACPLAAKIFFSARSSSPVFRASLQQMEEQVSLEPVPAGAGAAAASASASGAALEGQPLATGDLATSDGVPQKRAMPAFATPGGSLRSTTSMASFELAPLPKPIKSLYEHLRGPYFDSLVAMLCLVVAIALCVPRAPPRPAARLMRRCPPPPPCTRAHSRHTPHNAPAPTPPSRSCSSIGSFFAPWTTVSVSTFAPPLQTIRLEFSVATVNYFCAGNFCTPNEFKATYPVFMLFWYRQINNGGFAPYPNIAVASSDPGLTATCLSVFASA